MARGPYHYRRPRTPWGRNAALEMVLTVVVVVLVIALLVVFLFVYHDLPFRISTV
jgi:heme/copper-type cytochrome/quinol oxidase subunit 2